VVVTRLHISSPALKRFICKQISRVLIWLEAKTNNKKLFLVFCFVEQIDVSGCHWASLITVLTLLILLSQRKSAVHLFKVYDLSEIVQMVIS
jgi:hypothetical protein